jgi:hypothetical protein
VKLAAKKITMSVAVISPVIGTSEAINEEDIFVMPGLKID